MRGVIFITAISYFISLETAKYVSFVLRISSGNVNTSWVATCRYLQVY